MRHSELIHTAKYIKSIVYGGLDGIVTTFAVVAGVAGASLSSSIILILGFANLIADGISMAAGDYLSTKSEIEVRSNKKFKLKRIYHNSPLKNSIATFISFLIFGLIPLLIYVLELFFSFNFNLFLVSVILTGFALFLLGSLKSKITEKFWIKSGFETLLIGGIAAGSAYYIGYLISTII